ncbi:ABC transporter, putative [Eimeria mitis]|uniref:ABC transporter, putative n=1 Tax=Eimeria mitis TaxID=44415 RepID=U6JPY7_9EIME|nr:ABC transporter, putative [Eimeria mitis]CDJ27575.1 ABC transporter, putative [Eimeria mitis]
MRCISISDTGGNTSGPPSAADDNSGSNGDEGSEKGLWNLLAAALWPASRSLKARVVGAVVSLMAAKCLTIAAPVALASLIDHFTQTVAAEATQAAAGAATAAATAAADAAAAGTTGATTTGSLLHPALPAGLVISYPLARLGASAFTELRTALFTRVSQRASRELAATAFAHMHATSFSSNNKVGELTAVLTRGTKAISLLLNVLRDQGHITASECFAISGGANDTGVFDGFSSLEAASWLDRGGNSCGHNFCVLGIHRHRHYAQSQTETRDEPPRGAQRRVYDFIALVLLISGLLVDSLSNAEAVRYFTAEAQEAERFGSVQRQLENQMAKVNESLALLNFGQQLIFTSGLAIALLHTANLVAAGVAPVGQIVLVSTLLLQVVPTTLEFLMVLVLLKLRVGWTVAATAVATISAYWAFTATVTTRRAKLRREMNRLEGLSAGLLVDSLSNAEAVRYFTAEAQEAERFGSVQRQLENQMAKVNESLALLNFGQQLIFTSGLAIALLHTANLVAAGVAPVGQIVLVSTLLLQLAIPLNFIGTAYRELTLNTIDLEKLQQLLQLKPLVQDPPNPVAFELRGGAVEFRDVKFAYPPSHSLEQLSVHRTSQMQEMRHMHQDASSAHGGGKLVLDGFSLQVPAGSRVALVGESGCGKTTLIRLLYRLADPLSGVVSIDGQDLKTLPIMSFRVYDFIALVLLISGLLVDSLSNAEAVRYFTAEAQEAERFGSVQRQLENQMAKVNESLALLNFGQQLIFTSGLAIALLHTANLVAAGVAPVGQIVLVSTLLLQLAIPLNFIGTAYRELTLNTIDLEKLQQLLQLKPLVQDPPNPVAFELRGGAVEFRDVKFAYPPSHSLEQLSVHRTSRMQEMRHMHQDASSAHGGGKLVLDGFSLQVPAGSRVALVGESGCGKTTLIRLLYRLADPLSGVVSIDGQDLKTLPIMSFRKHIGVVPQDVALFNESLGFNLRYGSPHATDEQVKEAIRLAELTELVESLPDGLDTPVGDRGLRLSGGEKQRVGIARCLLRNPEIVLFDEATSALDLHTEHKILKEAIRLAELTELVESLPDGLDTPVGDRGLRLSGGEKQRVGIARCLLRNPEIVLFDEATSALDLHTEHKILKALQAVSRGRTTLLIAHRLSTVAGADTIAVLDRGRVAEIGTHQQLLQKPNGLYASMWARQVSAPPS